MNDTGSVLMARMFRNVHVRLLIAGTGILALAAASQYQAQGAVVCPTAGGATRADSLMIPQEIGSQNAPITVLAFSDFECFNCARSDAVLSGLVGQSKDVRLIFKHAPAPTNIHAILAHEAALAAAAQGKFWQMHDVLFANQTKLTLADLLRYARQIGLNEKLFQDALNNHTYRSIVESDLAEARALGVTTTPTFFINGRRVVGPQGYASLQAIFESLLAGVHRITEAATELTASGPAQTINLDNAPRKGPADAVVSLVEFSDFECPFCAETVPVVKQILAAYPQQVRFSFKHYPLPMHKEAPLAHEAALAAGEQGKFWEMHDLLFATQDKLTREDLIAKAKRLNLDISRFISALDSDRFKPLVEVDRQEGNGSEWTPRRSSSSTATHSPAPRISPISRRS